uniref:Importin putative n=1 Tax=Albugo laibachii Nc14 TaxID=890382 RepID=F0WML2_9STRA|nr:importin putative [Albugo laibachii Nc14]|eukprot:CCA22544.1 importin putative [Albugo laibachii Nc14]
MTTALLELLNGALCATNAQHRQQCEHQIMHLLHQPDSSFACDLCGMLLSTNIDRYYRQFACILLRGFIRAHWSIALSDENTDHTSTLIHSFTLSTTYKNQMKEAFLQIMKHALPQFNDRKSQTALCLILSSILEAEAQESSEIPWKEMMEHVVFLFCNAIASDSILEARLVMDFGTRFFALILEHFSGVHCIGISELLFPHLHRAFMSSEAASISCASRCRIIQIVQQLLISVEMEAQVGNLTAKHMIDRYLVFWCQEFAKVLESPKKSPFFAIEIRIVSCLTSLVREGLEFVTQFLPDLYRPMLATLHSGLSHFEMSVMGCQQEATNELEPAFTDLQDAENEGVQLGTVPFVVACIEFIQVILSASTKKTREWICVSLYDLWKVLVPYLLITEKQENIWKDDPDQYLADEEDDSMTYTIRHAAVDLLKEIQTVIGARTGGRNSKQVVSTMVQVAKLYLHQNVSEIPPALLWRRQEASLYLLGSLVSTEDTDVLTSNMEVFQENLPTDGFCSQIGQLISDSEQHPLLRGRALWCASHFASAMSSALLGQYIQISISGIDLAQLLPVRLSSCRAVAQFLRAAQDTQVDAEQAQIRALATNALQRLCVLMNQAGVESIHSALGSVQIVQIDGMRIDSQVAGSVLENFLNKWLQHLNDPVRSELLLSITTALLEVEDWSVLTIVHEKLVPPIQSTLASYTPDNSTESCTAASSALELLRSMLRQSFVFFYRSNKHENVDTSVQTLGRQLMKHLLDHLILVMEATDDERMLSTGTECLKWLLVFSPQALAEHTCVDPASGITYTAIKRIVQLTKKLLAPSLSEESASKVGGLLTQLLLKCSELEAFQAKPLLSADVVREMLIAVSTRLITAELPSLIQSLCMVFAKMMVTHGKYFLDELERLPPPQLSAGTTNETNGLLFPNNLLEFVFRFWIEKQSNFYGVHCLKITLSALLQILEWRDPRLMQLLVRGNEQESMLSLPTQGDTQRRSRRLQARSSSRGAISASIPPKPIHFGTKLLIVLANAIIQLDEEHEEEEWESSDEEAPDSGNHAIGDKDAWTNTESTKSKIIPLSDQWMDGDEADVAHDEEALNCLLEPIAQMSIGTIVSTVQCFMQDPLIVNLVGSELSPSEQEVVNEMLKRSS